MYGRRGYGGGGRRGMGKFGLYLALAFAAFSVIKFLMNTQYNEITGEKQHINLSPEQEIALGLQSTPQMIQQFGGLYPDEEAQAFVDRVGNRLVNNSIANTAGYQFDFHLLADPRTINAFALPGGQCFITMALFSQLENEDQLAGVMGHEIGHVLARHSAARIAKQSLTEGLTGAAVIATGDYNTAQAAQMIGNMIHMKYGRDQELESDNLGVRLMLEAGYNPAEMKGVMKILKAAAGDDRQPEFFSTHPDPENREEEIDNAIMHWRSELGLN